MNQRERFLAIVIGGLFVALGFQWVFNQYRGAIRFRQNRLNSLAGEAETLQARWLAGAEAEQLLGEYKVRSLSSDIEVAKSTYQSWLLDTVRKVGVADAIVDPVGQAPEGDLYTKFGFRVSGKTNLRGVVDLVYAIQSRDQLHRIREISFSPLRQSIRRGEEKSANEPEMLNVVLTLDAIALSIADVDPPAPSESPSYRIVRTLDESRETILNRNFFRPPNQPPVYEGSSQLVAYRGKENVMQFKFSDPEQDAVTVSVEGYLPEWARWDSETAKLIVTPPADETFVKRDEPSVTETSAEQPSESNTENNSKTETPESTAETESTEAVAVQEPVAPAAQSQSVDQFELEVIATDNGYPNRQTTQTILVKAQTPPPPPPEQTPPPGFDDATQTFLTALVQGRDDWTAWMNVRTRGKTLKLKIGDEFEIGSISGKVTGVSARIVTLEINGQSYELRPAGKLSDVLNEEQP